MEVVASLSQDRTAAAQCGLFTHKSVPVIFELPCIIIIAKFHVRMWHYIKLGFSNNPYLNTLRGLPALGKTIEITVPK